MNNMEMEIIKDNLRAYKHNFGYIQIVREECGKGFYVFTDKEKYEANDWTQFCYNIDYLNGWLYGAVQANCKRMKPIDCKIRNIAYEKCGYREHYAMDYGTLEVVYINNHECWKFVYGKDDEYQDANGSTFDTVTKSWIQ